VFAKLIIKSQVVVGAVEGEADFVEEVAGVADLLEEGAVAGVVPREEAAAGEEGGHLAVAVVDVVVGEE
jgi:hypothetical protein